MFKADDWERALDCALDSPATTAAITMAVLLLVPALASPELRGIDSREAPRSAAYQSLAEGPYNHRMRCWQHDQLLLEHTVIALPAGGALDASGDDRACRPGCLAESANHATCLTRSVADNGAPPQP
jgi:hypothetical protein